jgi:hypothetical protein
MTTNARIEQHPNKSARRRTVKCKNALFRKRRGSNSAPLAALLSQRSRRSAVPEAPWQ